MSEAISQKVTRAAYRLREAMPSKGTSLQEHEQALLQVLEAFGEMTDDLDKRLEAIEGAMQERMVHLDAQYNALSIAATEFAFFKNNIERIVKAMQNVFNP